MYRHNLVGIFRGVTREIVLTSKVSSFSWVPALWRANLLCRDNSKRRNIEKYAMCVGKNGTRLA